MVRGGLGETMIHISNVVEGRRVSKVVWLSVGIIRECSVGGGGRRRHASKGSVRKSNVVDTE